MDDMDDMQQLGTGITLKKSKWNYKVNESN